ncbi:MAG TPA: MerR family transcriptional regulator [Gaiellaceae bacterium]|nr:MerR family transcriptional regulator [Gaiellaceae bacterium]
MSATAVTPQEERPLTIGAVCTLLREEFPDISISKIRYLEDQGLLAPRRTPGRYRLYGEDEVERLRTILRLQRDEFLPLRVIRQELAAAGGKERVRRAGRSAFDGSEEHELAIDELCERAGVTNAFVRELEEYGLIESRSEGGTRRYGEGEAEVAAVCSKLARFGVDARHLRAFRTAADREVGLLSAIVAPALRARNPERRQAGVEDLQLLAELAQELSQLLFWRALRDVAST